MHQDSERATTVLTTTSVVAAAEGARELRTAGGQESRREVVDKCAASRRMAGTKDLHGAFSISSFDSSNGSNFEVCSGKGPLTWRRGSESAEATSTSQASAVGVVNAVAPALPSGEGEEVSGQTAAASPAAKISVAPVPHFRDAEDGAGAPVVSGDSGGDVCAVEHRCNGAPPGEVDGGSDGDTERLIQSLTCPAAAARSALGSNCSGRALAGAAQVPLGNAPSVTAGTLRGHSVSSEEAAIANMPESGSTSAEASRNVVERAYSVCDEYARPDDKRHAAAVEDFVVEAAKDCVVEESTSAAHTEVTAESACDGSTGGASDCCGCVGPIAETSVPDAAGVPPYLRIETLPALLEKEAGGRACVLLGQKKEALLYSVATPFGVNKCVLVCIYMLYAFLTGCVYFGWPSVSFMLLTSGAYSWRCPKDANGEFINDLRKRQNPSEGSSNGSGDDTAGGQGGKYYICDEQDAAVAPLFTIAYVTQSLMSVVAGTLLDHVSPKRAAMLGQLLNATGWVLLACSSYTFQAYIPAMVFIGLGADTAYLPTLLVAALFPGKRATVITLLGSANTASFAVPLLLELLWRVRPAWSFSRICWLYVGVGPLFCCCLAALFIPRTSFGSAALRKLPLQHQQSPLHGSKEDALLSAEEKEIKKRTRKGRRSSACCCCGFGTSQQDQQEKKHCELLRHCTGVSCSSGVCECCCCTDADEVKARMNTASRGRQILRRFVTSVLVCGCRSRLPQASKLLQRNQGVRLCFGPQLEQRSCTHVLTQQQQPRLYDLQRLEPEPSNNCGAVWPGDGVPCNQWRGSADGDAAVIDVSVEVESPAQEKRTDEEVGTVAESSTAAFNVAAGTGVEAKRDRSIQRSVNTGDSCLFDPRAAGQANKGFKVHVEADHATEPHEKRHCCIRMCARDVRSGTAHAGGGSCCACAECRDTLTSVTAQVQHSSCFAFLFPPSSSINKEAAENATSPQHCVNYVPSRLEAHADESREEEDAHGVEAVCAGAPAGLPELSSPAPSVDIEEKDEEEAEPSFCSQLLSSHFMCIVLYWSGMAVAISYFQSSSSRLFSTKALDFMDIALSFSFVPCVMLGKMIDLFGPFPALFLVNTMGVLAYCFALGGGSEQNVLQYVSIVAFCVYVSVDSEQVFCYVENTFNAKHFGKLSGLALTTGGVISLVSIPLYDEVTIRILKKNPIPVCCGLMVVLLVLYFTLGSMWFVRMKHPPAFKAKKKQMGIATVADPPAGLESALTSAGCITTEAEEKEGEEAYAVDGDDTHTAAGVPSCVHRRHSQSCCCCACAGGNASSSTHRMTTRSDKYMWKRSEFVSTNGEDNSTRRHPAAAVKCLVKRLRDLFRGRRCRTLALQQQRGAERQQQEPRGSSSGHGEDHLQAEVI